MADGSLAVDPTSTEFKVAVLSALRDRVTADLEAVTESQKKTVEGATHEEARPESDKDTRATESSYLARGLAKRVGELRNAAVKLANFPLRRFGDDDAIGLGALVVVEDDDGAEERYFIAPAGGGIKLTVSSVAVGVITSEAPLALALRGKRVGDEVELRVGRSQRSLEVVGLG